MKKTLAIVSILLLTSTTLLADKPSWAGNGGKPEKYEKEQHKEEMTSKHSNKHNKNNKHNDNQDHDTRYQHNTSKNTHHGDYYEGKGKSDSEYIEQKTDETKKNWIGKFFDFLN